MVIVALHIQRAEQGALFVMEGAGVFGLCVQLPSSESLHYKDCFISILNILKSCCQLYLCVNLCSFFVLSKAIHLTSGSFLGAEG